MAWTINVAWPPTTTFCDCGLAMITGSEFVTTTVATALVMAPALLLTTTV